MNCAKFAFVASTLLVSLAAGASEPASATTNAGATNSLSVEYGLNPKLGSLPTDNLKFKNNTAYLEDQNKTADARLRNLKSLQSSTNYLEEFSKNLEAILKSDASEAIKEQTRKLTHLELAFQREQAAEKEKDGGHLERALQLLSEYVERYPRDTAIPEVLLRQGHLLRRLELREEAIEKFYLVLRSVPRLEGVNLAYSRRIVLMAQSAIADTMADMGRHQEAADLYARMLQSKSEELEVETVRIKQLRSIRECSTDAITEQQARRFLEDFPESEFIPEVRYVMGNSLRRQGNRAGAMEQFQLLLEAIELAPPERVPEWNRWKMRVGNELANQFFLEGDTASALTLYKALAKTTMDVKNRQTFLYQVGLCEERLGQSEAAMKTYTEILQQKPTQAPDTNSVPLQLLQNMASLRISVLNSESSTRKIKTQSTEAP